MNPSAKNAEKTIPIAVSFFSLLFAAAAPINNAAMTPNAAARNHSSGIVVGRAITKAENPLDSYRLVTKLWREK